MHLGMSPHIRYYMYTIIRTRGRELRTRMQSGRLMDTYGRGRVGQARWTSDAISPSSLLRGSRLSAGACA